MGKKITYHIGLWNLRIKYEILYEKQLKQWLNYIKCVKNILLPINSPSKICLICSSRKMIMDTEI